MIERIMVHTATIRRPSHAKVDGRKVFDESAVVASGQQCRLEAAGDSTRATLLGVTADQAWQGWFPAGTDLRLGDVVARTDDGAGREFVVRGVDVVQGRETDEHIEALLQERGI